MSYIEFNNVKKIYKMGDVKIKALAGASFTIEKVNSQLLQGRAVQEKAQFLTCLAEWIQLRRGRL